MYRERFFSSTSFFFLTSALESCEMTVDSIEKNVFWTNKNRNTPTDSSCMFAPSTWFPIEMRPNATECSLGRELFWLRCNMSDWRLSTNVTVPGIRTLTIGDGALLSILCHIFTVVGKGALRAAVRKGGAQRKVRGLWVRDSSRFVKKANATKRLVMWPESKYSCSPWRQWKCGFCCFTI